ncbi:MAG TPA: hypothetical protein VGC69_06910 [Bordetella sp.]
MLLFLVRFLFGFALSLVSALLLAVATWLCLKLIALAMNLFAERRTQDMAGALIVLTVIAAALAALYGAGHALYGYMGAWRAVGQAPGWLAGPRLISPEAILGALAGFGGLAAIPGAWRWRAQLAAAQRDEQPAKPRAAEDKAAKPTKAAKSSAKPAATAASARAAAKAAAPAPKRPTIPQLGWLALFLLALGGVLLAFVVIVAPLTPAGSLAATLRGAGRLLPIYVSALALFGCGLLCLLLWRVCRRAPAAASR